MRNQSEDLLREYNDKTTALSEYVNKGTIWGSIKS